MTDFLSKEERSKLMAKVKSKNTKIEKKLIAALRKNRFKGFKLNSKILGKPDIIFVKEKVAIFCDGEFWHGYQFKKWKGKLNEFWYRKITDNIKRDRKVNRVLKKKGWLVLRFWERDIEKNVNKVILRISSIIYGARDDEIYSD